MSLNDPKSETCSARYSVWSETISNCIERRDLRDKRCWMSFLGRRIWKATTKLTPSFLATSLRRQLFCLFDEKLFVNEVECKRQKGGTSKVFGKREWKSKKDYLEIVSVRTLSLNTWTHCIVTTPENRLCNKLGERYKRTR